MNRMPDRRHFQSTRILAGAFAAACVLAGSASADLYNWQNDPSAYGYLCQYSIPNEFAPDSCIPTSTVNALAYLQNTHASQLGGVQLVGSGYAGWNATAQTLQSIMGTTVDGTDFADAAAGLGNYVSSIGAASLLTLQGFSTTVDPAYPSWMTQSSALDLRDLYGWISSGASVTLGIVYPATSIGHQVTMTGLNWNDANGDGVVDQSEGATITAIDPLDPSAAYSGSDVLGPPKTTTISVWQDAAFGGVLSYSYQQYSGRLPFDSNNYATSSGFIFTGTAISVVPGPASWIVVLVAGACGSRRRR